MSIYAIGDVQGCYDELGALLQLIQFDIKKDRLWFAGDLVCRGPKSLETLRFVRDLNLSQKAITVLGNHEMHLLALHYLPHLTPVQGKQAEFLDILNAPDCDVLCDWVRRQPFFHADTSSGYVLTHAGIFPKWTVTETKAYANELEKQLQDGDPAEFFSHIYGDFPNEWSDALSHWDRYRFIANALTRMRFCTKDGRLDFDFKGEADSQPEGLLPWFKMPRAIESHIKVLFGHWAALKGETGCPDIFALDGGCVWGGQLIAMRLEDQQVFKVSCGFKEDKTSKRE